MAEDSNDLCASLRRIADTVETNGGWHIAAIKVRAAADEIERLRAALREAADAIESWGAYASAYFQEKHDLASDIARFRTLAGVETPSYTAMHYAGDGPLPNCDLCGRPALVHRPPNHGTCPTVETSPVHVHEWKDVRRPSVHAPQFTATHSCACGAELCLPEN